MPTFGSHSNKKQVLNPKFKQQVVRLKNLVKEDLNIQISSNKMLSDKQYRLTVLNKLDDKGSDLLTELVVQLKNTPVYITPSTAQDNLATGLAPKPEANKSFILTILIGFLFVIAIASFVRWQNGSSSTHVAQDVEQAVLDPLASTGKSAPAIASPKTLTLPSDNSIVTLRLHGSNTVGEELAPALLESYLKSQSVTEMNWVQGDIDGERELQYIQGGEVYGVQLHSHGSSIGFQDLLTGKSDISMSSRRITDAEVESLKGGAGDLSTAEQEYLIGLDGIAVIVHQDNPIDRLSMEQVASIFSGEVDNWKSLGGADLDIKRYARDNNSGTWDTFNNLILKPNHKQLSDSSVRFESSNVLSSQVALDTAGIGFIGLPYVNNSKALAISATADSVVIFPTHFTVSTEDYALARRLYLYTPTNGHPMAQQFSQFVISGQGQDVVEKVGLVSLNIKLEQTYTVDKAPQIYNDYAQIASRLSVNFRFKSASNKLDNKAQHDIKRLVDYLKKHNEKRIVLMGFSDSQEDPDMSLSLSLHRARQIEKALNGFGLTITAVEGFGDKLPIASNETERGRSKNRRVEVWVF